MQKFWENLYGNDRERGKCTYVTKYGLNNAIEMLENEVNDAIKIIEKYELQNNFLKELAIYIKDRNK